jgi:hypothetical protein
LGNMQGFVKLVGIVYALLGLAAWFIGSDLIKGQLSRETSTQAPV